MTIVIGSLHGGDALMLIAKLPCHGGDAMLATPIFEVNQHGGDAMLVRAGP